MFCPAKYQVKTPLLGHFLFLPAIQSAISRLIGPQYSEAIRRLASCSETESQYLGMWGWVKLVASPARLRMPAFNLETRDYPC
jgi:hypothetical protein